MSQSIVSDTIGHGRSRGHCPPGGCGGGRSHVGALVPMRNHARTRRSAGSAVPLDVEQPASAGPRLHEPGATPVTTSADD